jgi:hypothetical protein
VLQQQILDLEAEERVLAEDLIQKLEELAEAE